MELTKALKTHKIKSVEVDYKKQGYHVEVLLEKNQVRSFAKIMLEKEFYLNFVTAVHIESGFQAVYQFGHFEESCHVNAKAETCDGTIETICDIFDGANWHERETHDFYGLKFSNHPDLRVLILDEEDYDLNPLLKNDKKLKSLEGVTRSDKPQDKSAKKKAAVKTKNKRTKPAIEPEDKKDGKPVESS
ncbi:MAG: NADH-quinone oxidoreductase subunit C [Desulfobacula sp.]|nr:NADH-quinone oxidoreductase subunit C [Desulfobacula sp.]